VARYLGDSSEEAFQCFSTIWSTLRPALLGRPAVEPRIWST
jgi:urease accessory protein